MEEQYALGVKKKAHQRTYALIIIKNTCDQCFRICSESFQDMVIFSRFILRHLCCEIWQCKESYKHKLKEVNIRYCLKRSDQECYYMEGQDSWNEEGQ